MWTEIIDSSKPKEFFARGIWKIKSQSFIEGAVALEVMEIETGETNLLEFEPIYFSIADEYVEDIGIGLIDDSETTMTDVVTNIRKSNESFLSLDCYRFSTLDWYVRFVPRSKPVVKRMVEPNAH